MLKSFLFGREQKLSNRGGFSVEQKSEAPWCVFLEQKTEAAWLDLYSRFG